jgi:hypothetical protein
VGYSFTVNNLYSVVQAFTAKTAISGRERQFHTDETFVCDPARPGASVVLEKDGYLYLVDRVTFKACCKWKNEGGSL